MYRIVHGHIKDQFPGSVRYRQGWWWHCSGTVPGTDLPYDPEGPFVGKAAATRHLLLTLRSARQFARTGTYSSPDVNRLLGHWYADSWSGQRMRPTLKPLKNTLLFGRKLQRSLREG